MLILLTMKIYYLRCWLDNNVHPLAVNKILSIRVSKKNLDNVGRDEEVDVRKFIIPEISTNARTYYSLLSLTLKDMHKPPALKHLLNKKLRLFNDINSTWNISATIKRLKGI